MLSKLKCALLILFIVLLFGIPSSCASANNTGNSSFTSVEDFGAKGDGITDDTIAIRNCITKVIADGGGTLYFPGGKVFRIQPQELYEAAALYITGNNLRITSDLNNRAKLSFKLYNGLDPTTQAYPWSGNRYSGVWRGEGIRFYPGVKNITIENIELDGGITDAFINSGNFDNTHKGIHIDTGSPDKIKITNCFVHNWTGELIYGGGTIGDVKVLHCQLKNGCAGAVTVGAQTEVGYCNFENVAYGIEQAIFEDKPCWIHDNTFKEIIGPNHAAIGTTPGYRETDRESSCVIENNKILKSTRGDIYGISITSSNGVIVRNNYFEDCSNSSNNACIMISNNFYYDDVNYAHNIVVQNNTIVVNSKNMTFAFSISTKNIEGKSCNDIKITGNNILLTDLAKEQGFNLTKVLSISPGTVIGDNFEFDGNSFNGVPKYPSNTPY